MSHSRSKKSRKKNPVPGIVLSLLLLVAAGIFLCLLYLTHMLTNTYLFVAAGACLIAVLITFYLTRNFRKRIPFVFGSLWFLLCIGIFSVGSIYLYRTQAALQAIAGTETEISNVSVYVRIDDPAQTLSDASGYSFGILSTLDRENTDTVVSRINEQLGVTIQTAEFDGLTQLADGLRNHHVDALILNDAYLDLYEEFDGYTEFPSQIRALSTESIETTVQNNELTSTTVQDLNDNPVLNIYAATSTFWQASIPRPIRYS